MKTTLQGLLAQGKPIVADGAMGSNLMAAGLDLGDVAEVWNVEKPEAVRQVHRGYIEAGSQIVLTNTFGGSEVNLTRKGVGARTAELNSAAARIARAAADTASHPVVAAGSIGPSGEMFAPYGLLTPEKAVASFAAQAAALAEGGVDVFWIETMSDLQEVKAAIAGCRQAAPQIPIVATMSFERKGRTMMGVTPEKALDVLKSAGVTALGGNCGNGPDEIIEVIEKMRAANPDVVLVAKANAGLPEIVDGETVYSATPEDMAAYATAVSAQGAQIIGACCGSNAAHIAAIAQALNV